MPRSLDRIARQTWAITFVAVLALLQPTLAAFDPGLAGWRPDHGHVFLSTQAEFVHEHPYDHHHEHSQSERQGTDLAGTEGPSTPGVLFTFDTGVAGAAIPVVQPPQLTPPRAYKADELIVAAQWRPVTVSPLVPPPRT
ncbi:MAG: hypothetical protein R3C39_12420 [Dehalococcoidia bacterium]